MGHRASDNALLVGGGEGHPGWPAQLGPIGVRAGMVALRPPRLRDGRLWSQIRLRDHHYLQPWEPLTARSWEERHSAVAWPLQWIGLRSVGRRGVGLPFVITVDGRFAGQLTVGNVVWGALRSGWIGYWVAKDVAGMGVATSAVAMAVDHCFDSVGLHRVEATVQPENRASLRVLEKLGFRQEGMFRRYLNVAGDWRDHLCFALVAEDQPDGLVTRLVRSGQAHVP